MKNLSRIAASLILTAGVLLPAACARNWSSPAANPATGASPAGSPSAPSGVSAAKSPANPAALFSSSSAPGVKLSVEPKTLERGSPCLFVVTSADALSSLGGSWMKTPVLFAHDQSRKTWYGLAGVDLNAPLGSQSFTLKGSAVSGAMVTLSVRLEIEARKANIRVPPEFTDPDDDERARIAREALLKRDAFKTLSAEALWNGSFLRPVDPGIRLTAVFAGTRRFNRGPVKVHRGADFGAPQGTSVKAINSGRVILAESLFYDGNMVTIDHGQGMLSLYLHLSKFEVKEGDLVNPGQSIGLSGSTGRSSGPHLHLQVKWRGIDLDPQKLTELKLPSGLGKSD